MFVNGLTCLSRYLCLPSDNLTTSVNIYPLLLGIANTAPAPAPASSDELPAPFTYHDDESIKQEDVLNLTNDTIELLARTDEIEKECRTPLSAVPPEQEVTDPSKLIVDNEAEKDQSEELLSLITGRPTLTVDTEATKDPLAPERALSLMERAQEGLENVKTACKGFFMEDGLRKSSRIRSSKGK